MPHQLDAPIVEQRLIHEAEHELVLHAPEVAREARPGQFVQLRLGTSYTPLTRRPFSVFWVRPDEGLFSIVYLARGTFTQMLARARPGDPVSVVGPLGNTFTVPDTDCTHHLLVAGGVGAPPLYFLAQELSGTTPGRVTVINGARTRSLLVGHTEFSALPIALRVATDDGTLGTRGLVTDVLREVLDADASAPATVYSCGPTPMLRAVAALCGDRSVPCQVSVETLMPCGVGVCMGCVMKVRDASVPEGYTYQRSCHDGPVFDAADIIWEDV